MKFSKVSSQPRKKRKQLFSMPLHLRQKLVSVHLGRELRKQTKKRSMPVRRGDKVVVLKGKYRKKEGVVSKVDLSSSRVFVEGVTTKNQRNKEFPAALNPSHLVLIQLAERKKPARRHQAKAQEKAEGGVKNKKNNV